MKKYIKPTVEVVELSVKESIAALSTKETFGGANKFSLTEGTSKTINTTIVDLLGSASSDAINGEAKS